MPEGHSIRHFANVHDDCFQGLTVKASSPQGRFDEGAEAIDGKTFVGTSTHGKHLFFHFAEHDHIVHIHLGLYGWFSVRKNRGGKPKQSARLRLENASFISELVGPTKCNYITTQELQNACAKLGPDPLHDDVDPQAMFDKIQSSKKSIASLLMNQSVVAGIGNVYRAELLFLEKLDPFMPGREVPSESLTNIWNNASVLMTDGATDGMIRTVAPQHLTEAEASDHKYNQYSYVYKRHTLPCRICGTTVLIDEVDGRKLYWCKKCQS
jgi:endonuclease-8